MKRSATANWKGSGKEGHGKLHTQSGLIKNKSYDHHSRFEDGAYTNPEELLAAAHAGCYSMKLSFVLGAAGLHLLVSKQKLQLLLKTGQYQKVILK